MFPPGLKFWNSESPEPCLVQFGVWDVSESLHHVTHGRPLYHTVVIVSDSAAVVDRALAIKNAGYNSRDIITFDNFDLWQEFSKKFRKTFP